MLELLPDEKKLAIRTRESLRKIHDILGSIHDSILQLVPTVIVTSSKEIQAILERKMILDTPRHHKVVNIFI